MIATTPFEPLLGGFPLVAFKPLDVLRHGSKVRLTALMLLPGRCLLIEGQAPGVLLKVDLSLRPDSLPDGSLTLRFGLPLDLALFLLEGVILDDPQNPVELVAQRGRLRVLEVCRVVAVRTGNRDHEAAGRRVVVLLNPVVRIALVSFDFGLRRDVRRAIGLFLDVQVTTMALHADPHDPWARALIPRCDRAIHRPSSTLSFSRSACRIRAARPRADAATFSVKTVVSRSSLMAG